MFHEPCQLKGTEANSTFSRSRRVIKLLLGNPTKGNGMTLAQTSKGEVELITRLGMVVAKKWGAIPPFAQDQILDQVHEVEAELTGVDIREALTALLERDLRQDSLID